MCDEINYVNVVIKTIEVIRLKKILKVCIFTIFSKRSDGALHPGHLNLWFWCDFN